MRDLKRLSKKMGMAVLMSSLLLFANCGTSLFAQYKTQPYPFVPDSIVKKQVDSLMQTLSVREKIAQIIITEYGSDDRPKEKRMQDHLVSKEKVGGIILMNDRMHPGMKRTNDLHRKAAIPLLTSLDGEWGVSMRYKEIPPFPRHMQLGALSSDSLVYKAGYLIGKECRLFNFHVNYAPDIDVNNNPKNPIINTRSFGEDKEKVARYGAAIMEGMRDAGVFGSAKHFPGHGDTDVDSHKALPILDFPFARLHSLELYPFRRLVEKNVEMVMVGHLEVHALDPSGTPASISKPIVTDYLRKGLGYEGIIITDALNMKGVSEYMEKTQIPLAAYKAGVDVLLMPENVVESITVIEKALENGEITLASLDEKVRKILVLKARLGLFMDSYNPIVETKGIEERAILNENKQFFSQVAKHSMTLVSNYPAKGEERPILPLKGLKGKRIAYLGYGGDKFAKECAQVLMRYAPVDTLVLRTPVETGALEAAKEQLAEYDLVILGIHNTDARPQYNFGMDSLHVKMLADWAAEQDIVAMFMGNPYMLDRIENYRNFKAFIIGYGNTLANCQAAAQLVFGGIPAIGELPVGAGGLSAGESIVIPKRIRIEHMFHAEDSTFRMEYGKSYGNHIVLGHKDTLWYNTPFEIETASFNEIFDAELFTAENIEYLQNLIGSLGMSGTTLCTSGGKSVEEAINGDEPLFMNSTLDDISKLFTMIMDNGEYGGETVMAEPVRDRLILEIYTVMKRDGGLKIGKNGLKARLNADTVDIEFGF